MFVPWSSDNLPDICSFVCDKVCVWAEEADATGNKTVDVCYQSVKNISRMRLDSRNNKFLTKWQYLAVKIWTEL